MFKHLNFLQALLLCSFLIVNGQDWQTVRSGRIAFFNNDQGQVKCIRIDSVKFVRDSVLYPMPNIQQLDYKCFIPKGNSWIGHKVIIQNKGINLFFNNDKDTIRIHTLARVGESWTLFEIKDSIKIEAEVKSAEIQTILGEPDSVKTIGLKVYDKNGAAANHFLFGKSWTLSKNNGFVKVMSLNEFPENRDFTYFEKLESLDLIGLTNPDRGVQNLTWLGVHDFQVGDELHVINNSWDWSVVSGYRNELKTIWKFLERKESEDSVSYRIERIESLKKSMERWDNISYSFTHDTLTHVYKPDTLFDQLAGEPIVSEYEAHTHVMLSEGAFVKKWRSDLSIEKSSTDSCWHNILFHGSGPGYYLKGMGGPYYGWNEIIRGDERALVYYKKGLTQWGTPMVITDVKSIGKDDHLKIYPNPAGDHVILENPSGRTEQYFISLTDMQGREVFRKETSILNNYKLDISSIREGAYLLKLQNQHVIFSEVIIKKP